MYHCKINYDKVMWVSLIVSSCAFSELLGMHTGGIVNVDGAEAEASTQQW